MNMFAAALGVLTDAVETVCEPPDASEAVFQEKDDMTFECLFPLPDEGLRLQQHRGTVHRSDGTHQQRCLAASRHFAESDALLVAVARLTTAQHFVAVTQFLTSPFETAPLRKVGLPCSRAVGQEHSHANTLYNQLPNVFLAVNQSHRDASQNNVARTNKSPLSKREAVLAALRLAYPSAPWGDLASPTVTSNVAVQPVTVVLPLSSFAVQYPANLPMQSLSSVSPKTQQKWSKLVAELLYVPQEKWSHSPVDCLVSLERSLEDPTNETGNPVAAHLERVRHLCADPIHRVPSSILTPCQWDVLWQLLRRTGIAEDVLAHDKGSLFRKLELLPPQHTDPFAGGSHSLHLLLVKSEDQTVVGSVFKQPSGSDPSWALLFSFNPSLNGIAGAGATEPNAEALKELPRYASKFSFAQDMEKGTAKFNVAVRVELPTMYSELHLLELSVAKKTTRCRLVNQRRLTHPQAVPDRTAARAAVAEGGDDELSFHFAVPTIDDIFAVDRWELFSFPLQAPPSSERESAVATVVEVAAVPTAEVEAPLPPSRSPSSPSSATINEDESWEDLALLEEMLTVVPRAAAPPARLAPSAADSMPPPSLFEGRVERFRVPTSSTNKDATNNNKNRSSRGGGSSKRSNGSSTSTASGFVVV